jgi:hypothetical protein
MKKLYKLSLSIALVTVGFCALFTYRAAAAGQAGATVSWWNDGTKTVTLPVGNTLMMQTTEFFSDYSIMVFGKVVIANNQTATRTVECSVSRNNAGDSARITVAPGQREAMSMQFVSPATWGQPVKMTCAFVDNGTSAGGVTAESIKIMTQEVVNGSNMFR